MPVMKGTELCQVLGNKIAEGHIYDLPVIISSANNSEQD
jgi:CheY-like chemotaxis protein